MNPALLLVAVSGPSAYLIQFSGETVASPGRLGKFLAADFLTRAPRFYKEAIVGHLEVDDRVAYLPRPPRLTLVPSLSDNRIHARLPEFLSLVLKRF